MSDVDGSEEGPEGFVFLNCKIVDASDVTYNVGGVRTKDALEAHRLLLEALTHDEGVRE